MPISEENISQPKTAEVELSREMPHWDEFLGQHPGVTIYHDPRWGQVMRSAYGNCPFYLNTRCEGKITGILQLVAQKSMIFGYHLCSLPYFDASGILADDNRTAEALMDRARGLLKEQGAEWIELRHLQQIGKSIPAGDDHCEHIIEVK